MKNGNHRPGVARHPGRTVRAIRFLARGGRQGKGFQDSVKAACETYRRLGYGAVEEVPVPYRQVGTVPSGPHAGRPIIQRLQSTVDFAGHLFGVPVALECKTFCQPRLTAESGYRELIHPHQIRYLEEFQTSASGWGRVAFAMLLCEFRSEGLVLAVPPFVYSELIHGRKSIGLKELRPRSFEVPSTKRAVVDFAAVFTPQFGQGVVP